MKFTKRQQIYFVQLYEKHRCLWDTHSPDYKNRVERQRALGELVKRMNIPEFKVAECKLKIKNVRSHYCQELKKIRNSKRGVGNNDNEATTGGVYKPSLVWFDLVDSFLRKNVTHQTADSKQKTKDTGKESEEDTATHSIDADIISDESVEGTEESTIMDATGATIDDQDNDFSKLPVQTFPDKSTPAACRSSSCVTGTKTEFDVFGSSVAAQLNKMPWENALELQLQIQQLITRYRLNLHRESRQV